MPDLPGVLLPWAGTYLIHGTLLLAAAWLLDRCTPVRLDAAKEVAWRSALIVPLTTATLQTVAASYGLSARTLELPARLASASLGSGAPGTLAAGSSLGWTLVMGWALLAGLAVARLVAAHRRFRRDAGTLRSLTPAEDARMRAAHPDVSDRVRVATSLAMPAALRGEIWIPERALRDLTDAELAAVLAHEAAHLRRADVAWRWGASLIASVCFFQPMNHLAAARLRRLSECLCDDDARGIRDRGIDLASALLAVARWSDQPAPPATAAALIDRESLTVTRVRRLLDRRATRIVRPPRALRLAAPPLLCITFAAAAPAVVRATPVITIEAMDPAGPFTLTVHARRVLAASIDGEPVPRDRIRQRGRMVRLEDRRGAQLALRLRGDGSGMEWTPRPARPRLP